MRRGLQVIWLCGLLACFTIEVRAENTRTPRAITLFNGTDLAGWVNVNGAASTWQVRDGELICSGTPRSFLRTEAMYDNYLLELDWRHVAPGGNSGLFVHADGLPQVGAPYPRAIEAQILDGDHGSLFGIRGASLIPLTNPDRKGRTARARPLEHRFHPVGEWNHYVLKSQNGVLELSVNGQVVTKAWRASQQKGYIALQAEKTEVHFRNIRLTPLPGSEPPADRIAQENPGFHSLVDGVTLAGWKLLPGHQGHWTIADGVIHYDGHAEGKRAEKDLWTQAEFGDFQLIADWRLPVKPTLKPHPIVLPNGDFDRDAKGRRKTFLEPDAGDSGIYLRGSSKCQINIWSQELGSGEINGYRTDRTLPVSVRTACLPLKKADHPFGEWNRFVITMRGDRVTVELNGETVIHNAQLPGVALTGPIALQHHGDPMEFRNLFIRKLETSR